ncbi:MAG TPA: DNA translocase FtsK 4TM domain-containing protein, partial [Bacteroidales bacterium]|nr:DNA translocase FtsK 4TM domain-containing protein [Bacteroidales bacterium]
MAKKSKNTKEKKEKKSLKDNNIIRFFKDEKFRISLGLLLLGFSILLCLSFTSYLFTWKADQSMIGVGFQGLFTNSDFSVENWMGKIGALISNHFIYNWFGLPSFSFVLIFGVFGLRLLNIKLINVWRFLFVSLIFTIWLSV